MSSLVDDDEAPTLLDEDNGQEALSAKVPLTIITGFLGAGKSTLLQHILTVQHGYRIAVIMNEFADSADIESRTIGVSSPDNSDPSSLSEEVLELANGCLCCTIKDSGAAAIEKLMKKRNKFDYILLETTGLADPAPIARIFWENESMSDAIVLDGVVCVVDGVNGLESFQDSRTDDLAARQIASSDVILLNKCDIANPSSLVNLERRFSVINPAAPPFRTTRGELDVSKILNLGAYSKAPSLGLLHGEHSHDHDPNHKHEHEHDHDHEHSHDNTDHASTSFGSISSLVIPLPVLSTQQATKLDEWLRGILWDKSYPDPQLPGQPISDSDVSPLEVLRCKGVFRTEEGKEYVVQGVRDMYETKEVLSSSKEKEKEKSEGGKGSTGKLVLIGWLGDREALRRSLVSSLGIHT